MGLSHFNIRDFGARSSWEINHEDPNALAEAAWVNWAAISKAIAAAVAVSGGEVYIPPGVYKFDRKIEIPARVTIRGDGQASILNPEFRSCTEEDHAISAVNVDGIVLEDFALVGGGLSCYNGFYFQRCGRLIVRNITVNTGTHAEGYGFVNDGTIYGQYDIRMHNLNPDPLPETDYVRCHNGIHFKAWNRSHAPNVSQLTCYISTLPGIGLRIDGDRSDPSDSKSFPVPGDAGANMVIRGSIESTGGPPLVLENISRSKIESLYLDCQGDPVVVKNCTYFAIENLKLANAVLSFRKCENVSLDHSIVRSVIIDPECKFVELKSIKTLLAVEDSGFFTRMTGPIRYNTSEHGENRIFGGMAEDRQNLFYNASFSRIDPASGSPEGWKANSGNTIQRNEEPALLRHGRYSLRFNSENTPGSWLLWQPHVDHQNELFRKLNESGLFTFSCYIKIIEGDPTHAMINLQLKNPGSLNNYLMLPINKATWTSFSMTVQAFKTGAYGTTSNMKTEFLLADATGGAVGGEALIADPVLQVGTHGSLGPNAEINDAEHIRLGPNGNKITYAPEAPSEGTWITGDIVYNARPVSGGDIGWVRVGNHWKRFGLIE